MRRRYSCTCAQEFRLRHQHPGPRCLVTAIQRALEFASWRATAEAPPNAVYPLVRHETATGLVGLRHPFPNEREAARVLEAIRLHEIAHGVRSVFWHKVRRLPPRYQIVIVLLQGTGGQHDARRNATTLRVVGQVLGVSIERVRQIKERSWRLMTRP